MANNSHWKLVTYSKALSGYFLFESTIDGYTVTKIFTCRFTALCWAKVHRIRFTG